jgi:hypothetical protein
MIRKPVFFMAVAIASTVTLGVSFLQAQHTTTTTNVPQSHTATMTIDTAQVVYVSGDDAVLRLPNGGLRLLEVPPGTTFTVNGQPGRISDLTPGSTVSNIALSGRLESEVTTVTQINGVLTARRGPFATVRLDDGTSRIYRVPSHATFTVNGQPANFNDVRVGSRISATAVRTEGMTTHTTDRAIVANAPQQQGTLLIEK